MTTIAVNVTRESYDVYIGRPSKWGNSFRIGQLYQGVTLNREMAIRAFEDWFLHSSEGHKLQADIGEIRGKRLGCYCKPLDCHGDILATFADGSSTEKG